MALGLRLGLGLGMAVPLVSCRMHACSLAVRYRACLMTARVGMPVLVAMSCARCTHTHTRPCPAPVQPSLPPTANQREPQPLTLTLALSLTLMLTLTLALTRNVQPSLTRTSTRRCVSFAWSSSTSPRRNS